MRAAQFHAAGDIRVEDIPPPTPEDNKDKILVEVEWCGICGSDLNEYLHGPFSIPNPKTGPHPLTNALLPLPMGHEFSGRILHVPESLAASPSPASSRRLRKGQAVVIDPRYFCSSCSPCKESATNNCNQLAFMGLSGKWGGLSEVVAVSPEQVYVLPEKIKYGDERKEEEEEEDLDLSSAALIEPLAVAWHAVKIYLSIAPYQSGHVHSPADSVLSSTPILVIGAGPVGIATVFVLRARGAKKIFVSEPARARREVLLEMGIAAGVFDPATDDVPCRIRELTKDADADTGAVGKGVGVVFDCAGAQGGLDIGCESLRFRGVYVNLALPKVPVTLPIIPFLWKEIMYKCSLAYDEVDFRETADAFISGRFRGVEKMITRRLPLEDIVEQGFKELIKPNDHIKILATPKRSNFRNDVH